MSNALLGALIGAGAAIGGALVAALSQLLLAARNLRAERLQWLLEQRLEAYRELIPVVESVFAEPTEGLLRTLATRLYVLEALGSRQLIEAGVELRQRLVEA